MKEQMKKVAKTAVKGHESRMHGAKKMAMGGVTNYQEGGGIREGRSRFGDDIRERAKKTIEARGLSDAEAAKMLDREPKKPSAETKRVPTPRRIPAEPLESKKEPKASSVKEEPKAEETPKPKAEAKPRVAPPDPKAAAARQKMWKGNSPITDAFNLIRGKDAEKGVLQRKAAGGSVSKRGDGCAIRGKTKGRMM